MRASYLARAIAYARRVVDGTETAGRLERLGCERFLRDLERQGSASFAYVLDEAAGSRACTFIELLPHIKGQWARAQVVAGELRIGRIRLESWQIFQVLQVFGWRHRDTGLRRFRRWYLEVARKNAKSTLAGGVLLYMFAADDEPGAHVYSAATTGEQAREVFDVARNMVLKLTEFQARFGVDVGKHDLVVAETASSARPLNAEGSTLDGLNVHLAVIDELHAHKTRALFDVLDSATGARAQPLIMMITTAGFDRSGICYEQRDYTIKVLSGALEDETWFGMIFTLDDGDDWTDPTTWRKANPNLGISVLLDDMQAAARKALAVASAQAGFLTKRLNCWVGADTSWMDMQAWDRCADRTLTRERVAHLPCIAGLDLASKVDVAAMVCVFYDEAADRYYLIPRFWLPERQVEGGANSQYDGWARAGHLHVSDGEVIDLDAIEDELRTAAATLNLVEAPCDPWQATQLISHMLEEGLPMVEYRQVVQTMSAPMKELEALVLSGRLTHDGNPMMTWMISNVVCHRDAKDNIYPRKERAENKIDGPVAAIMALGRFLAAKPDEDMDGFLRAPVIA